MEFVEEQMYLPGVNGHLPAPGAASEGNSPQALFIRHLPAAIRIAEIKASS